MMRLIRESYSFLLLLVVGIGIFTLAYHTGKEDGQREGYHKGYQEGMNWADNQSATAYKNGEYNGYMSAMRWWDDHIQTIIKKMKDQCATGGVSEEGK